MSVLALLKPVAGAAKRYGLPWFIGARAGNLAGAGAGYAMAGEDADLQERLTMAALGAALGGPPGGMTLAGPRIAKDVMALLRARSAANDMGVLGRLAAAARGRPKLQSWRDVG